MASKTPRTVMKDYLNASNTQTTKTSRIQSRVVDSPNIPRSTPNISTSKGKSPAVKLKSRSRPVQHDRNFSSKRKVHRLSLTTDEITPRTAVAAVLEGTDSTMPVVRQRARTSQTGVTTSVPAVLRGMGSLSQPLPGEISDEWGETPKTVIQKFLQNDPSSFETPLVRLQRIQQQKYISPKVSVPSQGSFNTPSPFKSSGKGSDVNANRSSTRKATRRTPRPHAPIIVTAPGSISSTLSRAPDVAESVPESYHTPSSFQSSMIEDQGIASVEIERKRSRQTQRKTFLLDIPDYMLDKEDPIPDASSDASSQNILNQSEQDHINIHQQNEESMDSARAEYSYELDKDQTPELSPGPSAALNQEESLESSPDPTNENPHEDPMYENSGDESAHSEMGEKNYDLNRSGNGSDNQWVSEDEDQHALEEHESLTVGKGFHQAPQEQDGIFLNQSQNVSDKLAVNHSRTMQDDQSENQSVDMPDVGNGFVPNQSTNEHSNFVANQSESTHNSFMLNKSRSIHNSPPSNQSRSMGNNIASNKSTIVPDNFVPEFTSTQCPKETIDEEEIEDVEMDVENEEADEPVVQPKKKTVRRPRQKSKYSLPVTLVKKQFTHFTGMRVDNDAMEEVMKFSEVYWDNLCHDLQAYANHAGRKTITMADFHLLFKRQGLVHERQCLYSLIEKFLPMEERRKLIPVARAGNRIELL